ncbi:MAG: hypothetical protein Q8P20_08360 [bacterium]|nr:hypothetical protein [bacterium]
MENSMVCLNCGAKSVPVSSADPKTSGATRMGNAPLSSQAPQPLGLGKKNSKVSIIVTILVILGFGAWGYFGDSTDNTNSSLTSVGDYFCSDEHADAADALFTNVDYTNDIVQLDALWYELENMVVDEYDQASIDAYDAKVDIYNTKADALDARIIASEGSIDEHDRKITEYNNYLKTNCEKE